MKLSDFQTINRAAVYVRTNKAGFLEKCNDANSDYFLFSYDDDYLNDPSQPAVSAALPKQERSIRSKKLHPFFDNLIVEGWLLRHAEKLFHVDKSDRFSMLMITGAETIGAVSVRPVFDDGVEIDLRKLFERPHEDLELYEAVPASINGFCSYCMKPLGEKSSLFHLACSKKMWGTSKSLKILLNENSQISTFADMLFGGSISGAQRKGMFALDKRSGVLKAAAVDSEYILKPDGDYPELPENEHVTMNIAKHIGITVPPFAILEIEGMGRVYAVKRFDRERSKNGFLKLLQEDMGQITGMSSFDKYLSSCEKIAYGIRKSSGVPVVDIANFVERLLFCFLTGNADMHLKNWSMLELSSAKGVFSLSPSYDLLNTRLAIPNELIDIGLPILGKSRNLQLSYFYEFARKFGVESRVMSAILSRAKTWVNIVNSLVPKSLLSDKAKLRYLKIVEERHKILFG